MRLLILGGTRFLGRHLAAAARDRRHDVTLFHRGAEGPDSIRGDRHTDLARLRGRQWDVVIDTSGYLPRSVRAAAEALADSVERYIFISSVSVYDAAPLTGGQVAQANAIDTSGEVSAGTYGKLYGGLKVLCEQAAEEVLPGRVLTIRAGVIAGPYDYTDRLTYWAVRIAQGGEVLAPGGPERPLQLIDARDLAEWIIRMAEVRGTGIYDAAGPRESMGTLLETCRAVSASDARFTWVSDSFLVAEGVGAWTEMPFWMPGESMPQRLIAVDSQKAVRDGLRYRPLPETIADTLAEGRGRKLRAGLGFGREQELLRRWHSSERP